MHKWLDLDCVSIHAAREHRRDIATQAILAAALFLFAILVMQVGIRIVDRVVPAQAEIRAAP